MMKSSRLLNLYKLRGVYYLCTVKTKINTPLMYEVLDKALKGPMRGWTHTGACSTGSIPRKPVGRDGTVSHLY